MSDSYLSFKLSDDFVRTYSDRKVEWGLIDAGGTSLAELVFLTKYSRKKEDGSKETWQDVCRRVVEGTYSIQKDWAKTHYLPWNDHKAAKSAQEMFERMFTFRWTPPGRGLQNMGSAMVNEQGFSTALQNCFAGSETFITKNGIQRFVEAEPVEEVWTASGWAKAEIKSFGVQPVQRMTFAPAYERNGHWCVNGSNHRVTVTATPNHRWELVDGSLTTNIQESAFIPGQVVSNTTNEEAFRHGLIFADGSVNYTYKNGDVSHIMRLCGVKATYQTLFENVHFQPNCNGDPVVYHRASTSYKELPTTTDSTYISSFVNGWVSLDGYVDKRNGTVKLTCQDEKAINWLIENAALAGFLVTGHGVETGPTNYGNRTAPLHRVSLVRANNKRLRGWKLISIESLPEPEEVFCAVVPEVERFTLASGIYTSNCGAVSLGKLVKNDPGEPFAFLMSASMMGVGIGYSTIGVDKLNIRVNVPEGNPVNYTIPDSREGWAEATRLLLNSYLVPKQPSVVFDYSKIRREGDIIKSFGTKAPGPEPLRKLHTKLTSILQAKAGQTIDSVLVSDIANLIGKCVVSGNTRRSALLAYGELEDKEFVHLKDYTVFPERMGPDGWGGLSNNSVRAFGDSDLSPILESIATNGEPGIIWEDVVKTRGRLIDPPDNKDARFSSFNPCFTDDTWILTTEGARQIKDLVSKPFTAIVDGKPYESTSNGFFLTDTNRSVYNLGTDEGWSVRLTDNHKIMTQKRGWVEAKDLVSGEAIVLQNHGALSWSGRGTENEGYLLGHLWGDGCFVSDTRVKLSLWGDEATPEYRAYIEQMFSDKVQRSDWKGFNPIRRGGVETGEWRLSTASLVSLAKTFGMSKGNKKITPKIEAASSSFLVGFLRAAFDTDGHVEGNKEKGVSVRISQSDLEQLQSIQRILGRFGIKSTIRNLKSAGLSSLPNGRGGYSEYGVKQSWRLIIAGADAFKYMEQIGFAIQSKSDKYYSLIDGMTRGFYNKPNVAHFAELEYAGKADVYDTTIEDVHAFDANGLYVHNCSEQPLEDREFCTLADVYVSNTTDLEDFKRTLKFAFLYAKTVTLLPTHFERSNAVMQRNRRIGLSLSGITDFIDDRPNGLQHIRDWFDKGYHTVRYYDQQYSEWLCVRESIRVTTVKPGGTTGLVASTSSGIHWTDGGEYYMRALRVGNNEPHLAYLRMSGHKVEPDVMDPDNSSVVYFPIKSRARRSARQVSLFEKAALAVEAQRLWSDNGVSVTLTFDAEREASDVRTVLNMYVGQLKSVSFLPVGNEIYQQQPYTEITQEDYDKAALELFPTLLSDLYEHWDGADVEDASFCTTDVCEIKDELAVHSFPSVTKMVH